MMLLYLQTTFIKRQCYINIKEKKEKKFTVRICTLPILDLIYHMLLILIFLVSVDFIIYY